MSYFVFISSGVISPNTLIGGVSSFITNATDLATYLSITASNISNFTIDGANISCDIDTNYTVNDDAFYENEDITYYHDLMSLCTGVGQRAFHTYLATGSTSSLTSVILEGVITMGTLAFYESAITSGNFPVCTTLDNEPFGYCESLVTLNLPSLIVAEQTFVQGCTALTSLNIDSCTTMEAFAVEDTALTFLDCPSLTTLQGRSIYNNPNLLQVNLPLLATITGGVSNTSHLARNNCREWYLPSLTSIAGTNTFEQVSTNNIKTELIYMPLCTTLGATTGSNNLFVGCRNGLVVVVDPSLETANGGSPDGDLAYVTGTLNGTVIYSPNQTAPDEVDDLTYDSRTGTSIKVSWTAPTTTNTILDYEIWVDGMYNNTVTGLSGSAVNLELNTSYDITVRVKDIYYNRSGDSNTVTQSTGSTYTIPTGDIVSYYPLDSNSNDAVGSNNGTDTSVSYVSGGIVSNCADYTAGSSSVSTIADDDTLSFISVPFSISAWIKFNATGTHIPLAKGTGRFVFEYQIFISTNSYVEFIKRDISSGGIQSIRTLNPLFTTSVWYHITVTDDGSDTAAGMKIYIDGVEQYTTDTSSGSFSEMENGTGALSLGKNNGTTLFPLNGYLDEVAIFDVELTEEQVSDIYAKGLSGSALTA